MSAIYNRAYALYQAGDFAGAQLLAEARIKHIDNRTDIGADRVQCQRLIAVCNDKLTPVNTESNGRLFNTEPDPYEGVSGEIRRTAAVILAEHPWTSFDDLVDGVVTAMGGNAWMKTAHRNKICSALATGLSKLGIFYKDRWDRWELAPKGHEWFAKSTAQSR